MLEATTGSQIQVVKTAVIKVRVSIASTQIY